MSSHLTPEAKGSVATVDVGPLASDDDATAFCRPSRRPHRRFYTAAVRCRQASDRSSRRSKIRFLVAFTYRLPTVRKVWCRRPGRFYTGRQAERYLIYKRKHKCKPRHKHKHTQRQLAADKRVADPVDDLVADSTQRQFAAGRRLTDPVDDLKSFFGGFHLPSADS